MQPEIKQGKWIHFEILTQHGALCKTVCQVTSDLLRLADKCFAPGAMAQMRRAFPPGTMLGQRTAAAVGNELHSILYRLAVRARDKGQLEPRLKCTRPATATINPAVTRRGERSSAGPDFVLTGIFDGEDIHAAWDLTTIESMSGHYDRDILGIRSRRRRPGFSGPPLDPEVQQVQDTGRFWTSYIALYY